ncbi:hypothetical protein AYI70_g9316 [Smittium culicis]|uniref:Uncharacterized protein n=1 Tax=Smittium culicis TaxID=133412 RepID=A0A1R1XBV6_9FUNG|nr:hypothetical protein AYI70_g9316 [Smittium culicis]
MKLQTSAKWFYFLVCFAIKISSIWSFEHDGISRLESYDNSKLETSSAVLEQYVVEEAVLEQDAVQEIAAEENFLVYEGAA